MSYANEFCEDREVFSVGQISVMLNNLPSYSSTSAGYSMSGDDDICLGSTKTYSVPSLSGVSNYTWEVPSGATIVSGQGSRTVSVRFNSSGFSRSVTVTPNSGWPAIEKFVDVISSFRLSGPTFTPPQNTEYWSATTLDGGSYSWSVPSGWSILSGQGTKGITARAGSSSGTISVTFSSSGCTKSSSLYVTVESGPPQMIEDKTIDVPTLRFDKNSETKIFVYELATGKKIVEGKESEYLTIIQNLNKGMYVIKRLGANGLETIKILKQ